jgi:hypothetical protein
VPSVQPTPERKVLLWDQPREALDSWLARKGEIKPLDFFACVLMEACDRWNVQNQHGSRQVGLFVPNNNRVHLLEGFGHGTTRIRTYRQYSDHEAPAAKMTAIRRQIQWARRSGEWSMPEYKFLEWLPWALTKPLVNWASDSKLFDLGTMLFTFLPSFSEKHLDVLVPELEAVYGLTAVTSRTPVTVSITGLSQNYHWSINYDGGRLPEEQAKNFLKLLQRFSDEFLKS